MGERFTYETKNTSYLETYEWDRIWYEYATNSDAKRAAIIGDSISCGYFPFINKNFDGAAFVDSLGTSKAVDNKYYLDTVKLFLAQQGRCDVIMFNNGLHGWHLSPEQYGEYYTKLLAELVEIGPKVVINLTTPVYMADLSQFEERNDGVIARNKAAVRAAERFGLVVNDMYSTVVGKTELYHTDGIHFNEEGYKILAHQCTEILKNSF